jgi:hypothetical protein
MQAARQWNGMFEVMTNQDSIYILQNLEKLRQNKHSHINEM